MRTGSSQHWAAGSVIKMTTCKRATLVLRPQPLVFSTAPDAVEVWISAGDLCALADVAAGGSCDEEHHLLAAVAPAWVRRLWALGRGWRRDGTPLRAPDGRLLLLPVAKAAAAALAAPALRTTPLDMPGWATGLAPKHGLPGGAGQLKTMVLQAPTVYAPALFRGAGAAAQSSRARGPAMSKVGGPAQLTLARRVHLEAAATSAQDLDALWAQLTNRMQPAFTRLDFLWSTQFQQKVHQALDRELGEVIKDKSALADLAGHITASLARLRPLKEIMSTVTTVDVHACLGIVRNQSILSMSDIKHSIEEEAARYAYGTAAHWTFDYIGAAGIVSGVGTVGSWLRPASGPAEAALNQVPAQVAELVQNPARLARPLAAAGHPFKGLAQLATSRPRNRMVLNSARALTPPMVAEAVVRGISPPGPLGHALPALANLGVSVAMGNDPLNTLITFMGGQALGWAWHGLGDYLAERTTDLVLDAHATAAHHVAQAAQLGETRMKLEAEQHGYVRLICESITECQAHKYFLEAEELQHRGNLLHTGEGLKPGLLRVLTAEQTEVLATAAAQEPAASRAAIDRSLQHAEAAVNAWERETAPATLEHVLLRLVRAERTAMERTAYHQTLKALTKLGDLRNASHYQDVLAALSDINMQVWWHDDFKPIYAGRSEHSSLQAAYAKLSARLQELMTDIGKFMPEALWWQTVKQGGDALALPVNDAVQRRLDQASAAAAAAQKNLTYLTLERDRELSKLQAAIDNAKNRSDTDAKNMKLKLDLEQQMVQLDKDWAIKLKEAAQTAQATSSTLQTVLMLSGAAVTGAGSAWTVFKWRTPAAPEWVSLITSLLQAGVTMETLRQVSKTVTALQKFLPKLENLAKDLEGARVDLPKMVANIIISKVAKIREYQREPTGANPFLSRQLHYYTFFDVHYLACIVAQSALGPEAAALKTMFKRICEHMQDQPSYLNEEQLAGIQARFIDLPELQAALSMFTKKEYDKLYKEIQNYAKQTDESQVLEYWNQELEAFKTKMEEVPGRQLPEIEKFEEYVEGVLALWRRQQLSPDKSRTNMMQEALTYLHPKAKAEEAKQSLTPLDPAIAQMLLDHGSLRDALLMGTLVHLKEIAKALKTTRHERQTARADSFSQGH